MFQSAEIGWLFAICAFCLAVIVFLSLRRLGTEIIAIQDNLANEHTSVIVEEIDKYVKNIFPYYIDGFLTGALTFIIIYKLCMYILS